MLTHSYRGKKCQGSRCVITQSQNCLFNRGVRGKTVFVYECSLTQIFFHAKVPINHHTTYRTRKENEGPIKNTTKKSVQGEALALLDTSNPNSIINKVPELMIEPIKVVCHKNGYDFICDPNILRSNGKIDSLDDRVRLAFWDSYSQATLRGKQMKFSQFVNVNSIYMEDFIKRYLNDPGHKLAYLLRSPQKYGAAMRSLLNRGVERLEEIMNLPIVNEKTGKVDTALISQILKATQLIDLRVKGAIVQKMQIQQQNLNYDVNTSLAQNESITKELANMSMAELEMLEKKLQKVELLEEKLTDEERLKLKSSIPDRERVQIIDAEMDDND